MKKIYLDSGLFWRNVYYVTEILARVFTGTSASTASRWIAATLGVPSSAIGVVEGPARTAYSLGGCLLLSGTRLLQCANSAELCAEAPRRFAGRHRNTVVRAFWVASYGAYGVSKGISRCLGRCMERFRVLCAVNGF